MYFVVCLQFPLVMFPAFRMQDKMQKYTLGEKGWVRIHARYFGGGVPLCKVLGRIDVVVPFIVPLIVPYPLLG